MGLGHAEQTHTPGGSAASKLYDVLTKSLQVTKLVSLVCKMGWLPPQDKAAEGLAESLNR